MVGRGGLDELRVSVDADHRVPTGGKLNAHPPGAAAGVQHPRAAADHCVEKACLPCQIGPLSGHPPEALDVPLRMAGAVLGGPPRRLLHGRNGSESTPGWAGS
jgi:hypothetical protein